jgi:hypothetical protein
LFIRPILLAGFLLLILQPTFAGDLSDAKVQESLRAEVAKMLPKGYRVTGTRTCAVPPDWHTDDPRSGFMVEGSKGTDRFEIFFLPRDWIGIRKVVNLMPKGLNTAGIHANDKYLTITFASDNEFPDEVSNLFDETGGMPGTSLRWRGMEDATMVFFGKKKLPKTDKAALALVEKHCKTSEEFAEAARSLVQLGVPAQSVFLRAARELDGEDQRDFCLVLGDMGGEEAIGLLCEIVSNSRLDDERRAYAVEALDGLRDKRIGPALVKALKQVRHRDTFYQVVKALTHLRYKPAGPDLLAQLTTREDDYDGVRLARALAAVEYKEAVPEIGRLVKSLEKKGKKVESWREEAELALLRLTAEWGEPTGGIRVMVAVPEKRVILIYLENLGKQEFRYSDPSFSRRTEPRTRVTVNGKEIEHEVLIPGGFAGFRSAWHLRGEAGVYRCILSENLQADRTSLIQVAVGDALSNVVKYPPGQPDKKPRGK